ncbi:hypothetical protein BGZ98_001903 [Dissophora globulifera]|nr:hypothetical protein BGZ98_001903 [Dissophora globulifera]
MDTPPATPAQSLVLLPPECLEVIVGFLRHDLASLHCLLLVSRQFFQLTVPVLYKSPFRLAAGLPNPLSAPSDSSLLASQPSGGHGQGTAGHWRRVLDRTKLLTRLLIQHLEIQGLHVRVPGVTRPRPQPAAAPSLLDDWEGFENLEPLLPSIEPEHPMWSKRPLPLEMPKDWTTHVGGGIVSLPSTTSNPLPSTTPWDAGECIESGLSDLISFDDSDGTTTGAKINSSTISQAKKKGLAMDYFYFYTQHDHRWISSVISEIYPGAGQREYGIYLAGINRAILMYNPHSIESIHIKSPMAMIPHLQANADQFGQLSWIDLLDPAWKEQELAMVYQFLKEHAAMFPASTPTRNLLESNQGHPSHGLATTVSTSILQHGIRRRTGAIRHFKYLAPRGRSEETRLDGQKFDPLQLMKALGPGLESIVSVIWPGTKPKDLESLDVSSLRSLEVRVLRRQAFECVSFGQPEFLSRCRQLYNLKMYSDSKDMFMWAAQDWNQHKRYQEQQRRQQRRRRANGSTLQDSSWQQPSSLWIQDAAPYPPVLTIDQPPRPLVRLQRLQIHAPTDQIAYSIVRDALYGFRETLQVLEARSDSEYLSEGESGWMDDPQEPPSSRPSQPLESWNTDKNDQNGSLVAPQTQETKTDGSENEKGQKEEDEESRQAEEEEECYNRLSWDTSNSLLIGWQVPNLTVLDLAGTMAAVFNIESLKHMPNLHTVCFAITNEPSVWVRRNIQHESPAARSSRLDMTHLPMVSPPSLRRAMIKGPWSEITDHSLQKMVKTIPAYKNSSNNDGDDDGDNDGERHHGQQHEGYDDDHKADDGRWGSQLLELSVLNNPRVTLPEMIRLARQMDRLQMMGVGLHLEAIGEQEPQQSAHHPGLAPVSSSEYPYDANFGGQAPRSRANVERGRRDVRMSLSTPRGYGHMYGKDQDNENIDDQETARRMIVRARVEMPWVDFRPDTHYWGRWVQRQDD